jgi:hypothetical protein
MDGELSRFEHVLLGAHLAVCGDCRRFTEDVRWQTESLRAAPLERLSRPVTLPVRRSWRRPALGVSTVAAVAASIAALAVGFHAPSPQGPPGPTPLARPVPVGAARAAQSELGREISFASRTQNGALRGDPAGS